VITSSGFGLALNAALLLGFVGLLVVLWTGNAPSE
jgi:nitrogen fixation-related uncharacterized protein